MADEVDYSRRSIFPTPEEAKCVLFIEDSEEAMSLVQRAVDEYGEGKYRLEWAQDLTTGLARIIKGGLDIVLLDLGLPDSSGASSYSRVHQIASEIPVLILTGDTREETELKVTARGSDDYLVKSEVSGALLVRAIEAAIYAKKVQNHPTEEG